MFVLFIVLENPNLALRFFFSEVLNKYVGESEANIRLADIRVITNRPFPISPGPLYQNEVECSAFDVDIILHSYANETHFHKK